MGHGGYGGKLFLKFLHFHQTCLTDPHKHSQTVLVLFNVPSLNPLPLSLGVAWVYFSGMIESDQYWKYPQLFKQTTSEGESKKVFKSLLPNVSHLYNYPILNKLDKNWKRLSREVRKLCQHLVNTWSICLITFLDLFPHLYSYIQVFTTPSLPVFFTFIFPCCFWIGVIGSPLGGLQARERMLFLHKQKLWLKCSHSSGGASLSRFQNKINRPVTTID